MSPRGGYRGKQAVKKSRKQPTARIAVYESSKNRLNQLSEGLKIPVIEIIHRILNHKDFNNMSEDISNNLSDNWHEQEV